MIISFRHKGLKELFETGHSSKVPAELCERCSDMLQILDAASDLRHVNVPGFDFHSLKRLKPTRYTIHVNGPWCITFEWTAPNALRVDLEQYH